MASYASNGTGGTAGQWGNPLHWTPNGVPGAGDTASIGATHKYANLDSSGNVIDVTIGNSPASGTAVLTVTGELRILRKPAGGTITFKHAGDILVDQSTGRLYIGGIPVDVNGGTTDVPADAAHPIAHVIDNSGVAFGAGAQGYRVVISSAGGQGARVWYNGVAGSVGSIAAGSGITVSPTVDSAGAQPYTLLSGKGLAEATNGANSGLWLARGTTFRNVGKSSVAGSSAWWNGTAGVWVAQWNVFDTCGLMLSSGSNIAVSTQWSFKNNTFKNSLAKTNQFNLGTSGTQTGAVREISGNVFDGTPLVNAMRLSEFGTPTNPNVFLAHYLGGSGSGEYMQPDATNSARSGLIAGRAIINFDAGFDTGVNTRWEFYDSAFILTGIHSNAKFAAFNLPNAANPVTFYSDGNIYHGDSHTDGLADSSTGPGSNPAAMLDIVVQNSIVCTAISGKGVCSAFTNVGYTNVRHTARHNTIASTGNAGSGADSGSISVCEGGTGNAGVAGSIPAIEDNLVLDVTGAGSPGVWIAYDGGTAYDAVDGVVAVARNNWVEKTHAPAVAWTGGPALPNGTGYNLAVRQIASGPTNDVVNQSANVVDPLFNLAKFYRLYKATTGTDDGDHAAALTEFAKLNDGAAFNTNFTLANLLAQTRANYKPQNTAAFTAAHDGTTVGAVQVAAAASPSIGISTASVAFNAQQGGAAPVEQTKAITNTGTGSLSGISTSISYGSGSGWLTATLDGTTGPTTLRLNAAVGALTPGTYTATVSVASTASGVTNSPQTFAVSFVVTAPPVPGIGRPAKFLPRTYSQTGNGKFMQKHG